MFIRVDLIMTINTDKLYYNDMFLSECEAVVVDLNEKGVIQGIVFDRTVAFPEGGGQEGDKGIIVIGDSDSNKLEIPFNDTQKGYGRELNLDDFPNIEVEAPVYHLIDKDNLKHFEIGMKIHIMIDIERRAKITVNHTGIHLVLMAIEKMRPGISKSIRGAHIGTDDARLDFSVSERFSSAQLEEATQFVNEIVDSDETIQIFHHPDEPEAWYWKCLDEIYPCGGTHLPSSKFVGHTSLKRKNIGKNLDRIIATFPDAEIPLELYHSFE